MGTSWTKGGMGHPVWLCCNIELHGEKEYSDHAVIHGLRRTQRNDFAKALPWCGKLIKECRK